MADMKYTGNLWHDLCDFLVELGRERRAAAAVPTPDDAADPQPAAPAPEPVAPQTEQQPPAGVS
jgi:hypothetical protein